MMDCNLVEMALYSGIHRDTLRTILDSDPDFSARIDALKETPILAAKGTVAKGIKESYGNAMDYLSRKRRKEFGNTKDVDDRPNVTFIITKYGENGSTVQLQPGSASVPVDGVIEQGTVQVLENSSEGWQNGFSIKQFNP